MQPITHRCRNVLFLVISLIATSSVFGQSEQATLSTLQYLNAYATANFDWLSDIDAKHAQCLTKIQWIILDGLPLIHDDYPTDYTYFNIPAQSYEYTRQLLAGQGNRILFAVKSAKNVFENGVIPSGQEAFAA